MGRKRKDYLKEKLKDTKRLVLILVNSMSCLYLFLDLKMLDRNDNNSKPAFDLHPAYPFFFEMCLG